MALRLYDGEQSPNARKVRLLAAELDLPLEYIRLDISAYRLPDYLAKNPNGKIPTLDHDGFVLWESAAILRYLAAMRPERGLVPANAKEQALLDQWLFFWTAHPEAALYLLVAEKLVKPFLGKEKTDEGVVKSAETELARYLPVMEKKMEGKEHFLGKLSILDFAAVPWLESSARVGVNFTLYPNLARWMKTMQARPYWTAT